MSKESNAIEAAAAKLLGLALTPTNNAHPVNNDVAASLVVVDFFAYFRASHPELYKASAKAHRALRERLTDRVKSELNRKDDVAVSLQSVLQEVARVAQASAALGNRMPAIRAAQDADAKAGVTQAVAQVEAGKPKVRAVKAEIIAPDKAAPKPAKKPIVLNQLKEKVNKKPPPKFAPKGAIKKAIKKAAKVEKPAADSSTNP